MGNKNRRKKIQSIILFLIYYSILFCVNNASADNLSNKSISVTATVAGSSSPAPVVVSSGGGGGGNFGSVGDSVIFKGIAYPGSTINLTQDGVVVATVPASPDATFQISIKGLSTGTYSFGIQGVDSDGRKSLLLTYAIYIASGVTTTVDGFFLPPTLSIDKSEVKRGDTITVVGRSVPQAKVNVVFNSETNLVKKTIANELGVFIYKLNTIELAFGNHEVKAQASSATDSTPFSQSLGFKVGNTNVAFKNQTGVGICSRYNVNCDTKINLVDFSIMVYWFHRSSPPKNVDLNGDGKVDLSDFSILAYNWKQ